MIKKALEYLVELAKPEIITVDGRTYTDKQLERVVYDPMATAIQMNTLSSLVAYIKSGVDKMKGKMIIHVVSPTRVELFSQLDNERRRECVAVVNASVPGFCFGRYMDHETFCIGLQSKFLDVYDRSSLLKFAGTVEAGTVAEYGDDGISQKATIKTGIASKGDAIVPNPVVLIPYRTFNEVPQVQSCFVFRMRGDRNIECALFEADGGAWENEAMMNIKEYLETELDGIDGYIVIC